MENYDVIIAGGGPAGLTAAFHLAEKGMKTCVLERKKEIGYPVCCGEAVSKKSLKQVSFYDDSFIDKEVKGFRIFLDSLFSVAREKRIRWNIIACGPRNTAYADFIIAIQTHPDAFNVLLVDSESPVATSPWKHLNNQDGWELQESQNEQCHHR